MQYYIQIFWKLGFNTCGYYSSEHLKMLKEKIKNYTIIEQL